MDFYLAEWSPIDNQPVEGQHQYALPLVECPLCKNSKSAGGLWYPDIDPESIFDPKALRRMNGLRTVKGCSWEEFKSYVKTLREVFRSPYPLAPGTSLGVFTGKLFEFPPDFVMPFADTLLATRKAVEKLRQEGFSFSAHDVRLRSKRVHDLVEVYIPPAGLSLGAALCPECERGGTTIYGEGVRVKSVPENTHLFRMINNPNFLVFTSRLVEGIRALELRGLKFKKLPVG